jgi:hypothetical protein
MKASLVVALILVVGAAPAPAQVQVRVGEAGKATYSELHEALRPGTPAADSVLRIYRMKSPARLWSRMDAAVRGTGDWNSALLALTRLATLRNRGYADSAARLQRRLEQGDSPPFPENPGLKAEDLQPSLQAIVLERRRAEKGDAAVLAEFPQSGMTMAMHGCWEGWARAQRTRCPHASARPTQRSSGCDT